LVSALNAVIGQMLPSALGVALSPLPFVAVVLVLVTRRARTNYPAFIAGWVLGVGILSVLVLLLAAGASPSTAPLAGLSDVLPVVLGVALMTVGLYERTRRPPTELALLPPWVSALASFTPAQAAGIAMLLSCVSLKNLLLVVAGSQAIAQADASFAGRTALLALFVLIASIGVLIPVALYLMMGEPARQTLDSMKRWTVYHQGSLMPALLVVLGAVQCSNGIAHWAA
jgi:hypothetical protein